MNKILEYILSFTKDRQDRVAVGAMTSGIVYVVLVFILVNFVPEWYRLISISASFVVTLVVGILVNTRIQIPDLRMFLPLCQEVL